MEVWPEVDLAWTVRLRLVADEDDMWTLSEAVSELLWKWTDGGLLDAKLEKPTDLIFTVMAKFPKLSSDDHWNHQAAGIFVATYLRPIFRPTFWDYLLGRMPKKRPRGGGWRPRPYRPAPNMTHVALYHEYIEGKPDDRELVEIYGDRRDYDTWWK